LALAALGFALVAGPALAATSFEEPKDVHWSFEGPFGQFDKAQLQRGYKIYREVCSACHAMDLMYFRNLGQAGGPFFDPKFPNSNDNPYVKSLAKDIQVGDIDSETGDAIKRPATSADKFPSPVPERGRRARVERRGAAAGSVGDRQGA
jgi:ubiquinol-cytochrome c reductase cytochrome c1 subunit